jgi:hypothetical protein
MFYVTKPKSKSHSMFPDITLVKEVLMTKMQQDGKPIHKSKTTKKSIKSSLPSSSVILLQTYAFNSLTY